MGADRDMRQGGDGCRVTVGPLPAWIDTDRLLGVPHELRVLVAGDVEARFEVPVAVAADVAARLRGLSLAARPLRVGCEPRLARAAVRNARTRDARRRRVTTPGFLRAGIRTDDEGGVSLTPEQLACQMAEAAAGATVLDASCGLGGNAIAFARAGCRVTAVELNRRRLTLARHNAGVYGVLDRIHFVEANALAFVPQASADLVMIDPPWGTDWNRGVVTLDDLPLLASLLPNVSHFPRIWLKLPPSFDDRLLPEYRPQAVFGLAEGDRRRVKFLWLAKDRG